MKDDIIIKEFRKLFKKMPPDMAASELVVLFRIQRKKYKGLRKDYDRDACSLIDLKNGLIVGSGICPDCRGWLGRADTYEE